MTIEKAMKAVTAFMRDMARAFRRIMDKLREIARSMREYVKAHTRLDATLTVYEDWGTILWDSPESFNDTVTRMTRRQL